LATTPETPISLFSYGKISTKYAFTNDFFAYFIFRGLGLVQDAGLDALASLSPAFPLE
jgi:hypothetical protein